MSTPLNPLARTDPGTGAVGTWDGQPIHQGPVTPPRVHVNGYGTPYHVFQNPDSTWGASYAGDHPDADPSSWHHATRDQLTRFLNDYDPAWSHTWPPGNNSTSVLGATLHPKPRGE